MFLPHTTDNYRPLNPQQLAAPLTTLPTSDAAPAAMPGLPGMSSAATGRAGVVRRYGLKMTVMSRPLSGG
nr:hypothetical protein [Mycobacterium innocens]